MQARLLPITSPLILTCPSPGCVITGFLGGAGVGARWRRCGAAAAGRQWPHRGSRRRQPGLPQTVPARLVFTEAGDDAGC